MPKRILKRPNEGWDHVFVKIGFVSLVFWSGVLIGLFTQGEGDDSTVICSMEIRQKAIDDCLEEGSWKSTYCYEKGLHLRCPKE